MTDMKRFDRLSIHRFRGLAELELDNIGLFNVLLGANDVGKTSILEAIFLLSGAANSELSLRVQTFRHYRVNNIDDLLSLFHELVPDEPIELAARFGDIFRKLEISAGHRETTANAHIKPIRGDAGSVPRLTDKASPGSQSSMSLPSGSRALLLKTSIKNAEGVSEQQISMVEMQGGDVQFHIPMEAARIIVPATFIRPGHEYDNESISRTIVNKKSNILIEYLQAVNPRITDVAVSGNVAYLDVGLNSMLPLNMFGGGMVRAMSILSWCIAGGQRIMLIDEIENGLHHSAVASLLRALFTLSRKEGIQFFVTTHSVEFLDNLRRVLLEEPFADYRADVNCYALQRDKAGCVHAYRYAYDQFDHCIAQGLEIR